MFKLALLLFLAGTSQALNSNECINEMHGLSFMVKQGAPDIMAYLTANYCPGLTGHEEQCENDLTRNYVGMLWMVVEHFFVDGAQHTFPYTCEECVEGLEVVGSYMTDPLWIAMW